MLDFLRRLIVDLVRPSLDLAAVRLDPEGAKGGLSMRQTTEQM